MTSPTTPRDAIGLSERLRFDATRCELHFSKGVASNIEEAATQLDALSAERDMLRIREKELEDDVRRLHSDKMDQFERAITAESRATRAEQERETLDASWRETLRVERDCTLNATRLKDKFKQERDALEETARRHEQTLKDNGIGSHTEAVVLVVDLRRQLQAALQERDEAYERAAKVCKDYAQWAEDQISGDDPPESSKSQLFATISNTADDCAEKVRRLAAGPEKEKRE